MSPLQAPPAPSRDRSTLRLSEVARHVVIPAGIERSLWQGWDGQEGVLSRCHEMGVEFDTWQDNLGQVELGVRADGRFAATVGGIILSIPRQVAKTFLTMCIVVALCTLFPNLTVLWTAHRTRTATQTFQKMQGFVRRKRVRRHLQPGRNQGIRTTNGEQEIHFRNGSKVMFGARDQGFGRGFDEVDIEVFDEAQILQEKALEDMVAATNQSRWSFGALLFFMGTPPRPTDPGREFRNRRDKALRVKGDVPAFGGIVQGGKAVFVECSADPDCGDEGGPELDDRRQVERANPSYPHRTPDVSIERLRENLTSDESWRREGLGIWDDFEASELILPTWYELAFKAPMDAPDTPPPAPEALGIMADAERTWLSLGSYGGGHMGAVARMPFVAGRREFVAEVARIAKARDLPVVVQEKTGAALLAPELEALGVTVHVVPFASMVRGVDLLEAAVAAKKATHGDYDALNAAVAVAKWKLVGDQRVFDHKAGDVSMLEAVALAWHLAAAPVVEELQPFALWG